MKKSLGLVLCVLLITLSSFVAHKFYVCVTQVEYNKEQQSLQIISRVFIDDFEELLKQRYDPNIRLEPNLELTNAQKAKIEDYMRDYFRQKMTFIINGEERSFVFLGKEYEEDLMLLYLEIENVTSLDTFEISNQLLMDLFEEQQNIVHVKNENIRKSLILEKRRDTGMLKFSE